MGHITNSIAFRLGGIKKWENSWVAEKLLYKKFIQEDFLIKNIVSILFTKYTKNDILMSSGIKPKMIKNPFTTNSFTYGESKIFRLYNTLGIKCMFLDVDYEKLRQTLNKKAKKRASEYFVFKKYKRYLPTNALQFKRRKKLLRIKAKVVYKKLNNFKRVIKKAVYRSKITRDQMAILVHKKRKPFKARKKVRFGYRYKYIKNLNYSNKSIKDKKSKTNKLDASKFSPYLIPWKPKTPRNFWKKYKIYKNYTLYEHFSILHDKSYIEKILKPAYLVNPDKYKQTCKFKYLRKVLKSKNKKISGKIKKLLPEFQRKLLHSFKLTFKTKSYKNKALNKKLLILFLIVKIVTKKGTRFQKTKIVALNKPKKPKERKFKSKEEERKWVEKKLRALDHYLDTTTITKNNNTHNNNQLSFNDTVPEEPKNTPNRLHTEYFPYEYKIAPIDKNNEVLELPLGEDEINRLLEITRAPHLRAKNPEENYKTVLIARKKFRKYTISSTKIMPKLVYNFNKQFKILRHRLKRRQRIKHRLLLKKYRLNRKQHNKLISTRNKFRQPKLFLKTPKLLSKTNMMIKLKKQQNINKQWHRDITKEFMQLFAKNNKKVFKTKAKTKKVSQWYKRKWDYHCLLKQTPAQRERQGTSLNQFLNKPSFFNLTKVYQKRFLRYHVRKPHIGRSYYKKKRRSFKVANYPLLVNNLILKRKTTIRTRLYVKFILILSLIRLAHIGFRANTKRKKFYITQMFINLSGILKLTGYKFSMFFLFLIISFMSYIKDNKSSTVNYFKKLISARLHIFNACYSSIFITLKSFTQNLNTMIYFVALHPRNPSPAMISNYIGTKLGQYFKIKEIIKPLVFDLRTSPCVDGFRVAVAGRLTRKERGAFIMKKDGRLTLAKKNTLVEFATSGVTMRFGSVGVKTWIKKNQFKSNIYGFIYKNKKQEKNQNNTKYLKLLLLIFLISTFWGNDKKTTENTMIIHDGRLTKFTSIRNKNNPTNSTSTTPQANIQQPNTLTSSSIKTTKISTGNATNNFQNLDLTKGPFTKFDKPIGSLPIQSIPKSYITSQQAAYEKHIKNKSSNHILDQTKNNNNSDIKFHPGREPFYFDPHTPIDSLYTKNVTQETLRNFALQQTIIALTESKLIPPNKVTIIGYFGMGSLGDNTTFFHYMGSEKNTKNYIREPQNYHEILSENIQNNLSEKATIKLQYLPIKDIGFVQEAGSEGKLNFGKPKDANMFMLWENGKDLPKFTENNTKNKFPDLLIELENSVKVYNSNEIIKYQAYDIKCWTIAFGKENHIRVISNNFYDSALLNINALANELNKKKYLASNIADTQEIILFLELLNKSKDNFTETKNVTQLFDDFRLLYYQHQNILVKYTIPMNIMIYFENGDFKISQEDKHLFLNVHNQILFKNNVIHNYFEYIRNNAHIVNPNGVFSVDSEGKYNNWLEHKNSFRRYLKMFFPTFYAEIVSYYN